MRNRCPCSIETFEYVTTLIIIHQGQCARALFAVAYHFAQHYLEALGPSSDCPAVKQVRGIGKDAADFIAGLLEGQGEIEVGRLRWHFLLHQR